MRYHSAKSAPPAAAAGGPAAAAKAKYDICPNCYLEGRFPASSSAVDFVKLEDASYSAIPDRDAPWTDAELLLLLEGLELFDDNWSSVADHVGTRTREECVLKFLQLEIEDKYLDNEPTASGSGSLGVLGGGRPPYNQADNPVLSVVGFLASLGDQGVAAAAAGKSADEMRRSLRDRLEKGVGEVENATEQSKDSNKGKASDEGVKNQDSMDVDHQPAQTSTELVTAGTPSGTTPAQSASNPLATIPLAASAARGTALASHEEREMTQLVSAAVNATLQKFDQKLRQFKEMEAVLQTERRELEHGRQQLFLDRLAFKKRVREAQEALRLASLTGGEEGAKMGLDASAGSADAKLGFKNIDASKANGLSLSCEGSEGKKTFEL